MSLSAGTRLGTFEILDLLGAGGMGEVYKARDTRLERTVALKVLPPHWADNVEMKQRFEREAQVIASLNHPNICTLHDIGHDEGVDFLVLEYLEGETLAQRLGRIGESKDTALTVDEALTIAIQIADALDKAHRRGVTHRDLKPGNIFLTRRGASDAPIAKLLDFGLAKLKTAAGGRPAWSSGVSVGALSALPTGDNLTAHGAILGTLQYMAPEQLEGVEADARTDIFAFGTVVHEMITGKKAFEGKSQILLISAIATSEPLPLSHAQPGVPPALDHVVKTCLAKDPRDRWQTTRDLLAELQWIAGGGAEAVAAPSTSPAHRTLDKRSLAALAATALIVAALSVPAVSYFRAPTEAAETRFRVPIQLSAQAVLVNQNNRTLFNPSNVSISPDGRAIALVARSNPGEPWSLFVRPVGSVTPQRLAGAEEATQLFWSADSRSLAFVAGGKLKKVEASGGPPQDICEAGDLVGGTWNADGTILFGSARGLFRVSAQGGKPTALTTLEASESGHFWPHFLPDGRRYLYLVWAGQTANRAIYAGTIDTKERTRVMPAESKAAYAEPGYLLFRRENTVYAQAFQQKTLTLAGEPIRVADEVTSSGSTGHGDFTVASTGALIYFRGGGGGGALGGPQSDAADWQLAWVERAGQQLKTVGPFGPYRGVSVAPDGERVAVHRHEPTGGDVWVIEPRGAVTRLTFDAARHNAMPVWSPDGKHIVYSSLQKGKWGLYKTLSDGAGTEELLFESDLQKVPMSWSPDSKRIVYWVQDPKTAGDLWILPLEGDKKPTPFLATTFNESHAQISPDGKWIAYTSNSTGRNEIYVQPFPSGPGIWQVSTAGGDWARWRRDGKELFFHALGNGAFSDAILSAPVNGSGSTFVASGPKEVVLIAVINLSHSGGDYHPYDVAADGQRFLVTEYVNTTVGAAGGQLSVDPASGLIVALDWASSLKK